MEQTIEFSDIEHSWNSILKDLDTKITQVKATTEHTFSNKMDNSYDPKIWTGEEEDSENTCCSHIKISSEGKARAMYPHILGKYQIIDSSYDIKLGKKPLYLTQPESAGPIWGYTWGVNHSPVSKWGYIRSSYTTPCPSMAGQWTVFDKNTKKWAVDRTLKVTCSGN